MTITLDKTIEQKQQTWLAEKLGSQTFWVFIAVILACLFLSFATDSFATSKNLYNITRNVTFVAIIALGMTLVIITGGIDLSVGSVLCLCSMVLGVVMHAGYSIEIGILASIATALAVGAFNGVLVAYLGFPPFVVTLGMLSIGRSLAMVTSGNTVVFQFGPDHEKLLALGGGAWFFGIANPAAFKRPAFLEQLLASGHVNRSIDTAPAEELCVGGVDNRVHRQCRDVSWNGFDVCHRHRSHF